METNSIVSSSSVPAGRSLSTKQELETAQKNQLRGVNNKNDVKSLKSVTAVTYGVIQPTCFGGPSRNN